MNEFCVFCGDENNLKLMERDAVCEFKGELVSYKEKYYLCEKCGEEFYNGGLLNENLQHARNEYRLKHGLLTSDQIKQIREKYGLSQSDLALILGWGEVTITRYETKEIQNENYDSVLRKVGEDPYYLFDNFKINSESFDQKKQMKIIKKIFKVAPNEEQNNRLLEETLIKKHFSISDDKRGNQDISLDKIIAVIGEMLKRNIDLFKTKMVKLLWYVDMVHYKLYNKGITGLAYFHMPYGACPLGLDLVLDSKNVVIEEVEEEDYTKYLIKSAKSDYKLNEKEIKAINIVLDKFENFSTSEIVKFMHKEKAYIETNMNDFIPFSYAKSLNI